MPNRCLVYAVCAGLIALPVVVGASAQAADKPMPRPLLKSSRCHGQAKMCDDLYKRCKRMFIADMHCAIMLPVCAVMCK